MNGFMENIKLKAVVREYEQEKFQQHNIVLKHSLTGWRVSATQWS